MTTKSIAQIWADVRNAVAASSEGGSWKIWLNPTRPRDLSDNTLILNVPNEFTKEKIQESFLQIMEESLSQICGRPMKIELAVTPQTNEEQNLFSEDPPTPVQVETKAAPPIKTDPAQPVKSVQKFDSHLSPKYTFDNFIRG
ncbi:DnaA N-terminal domain-containing protein, partial [Acidaminococcus timonensis]